MMLLFGLGVSIFGTEHSSRSNHRAPDSPAGLTTPRSRLQYFQARLLYLHDKFIRKTHFHLLPQREKIPNNQNTEGIGY